jgi:uncharacterized protein (TIGR02996 family)
VARYEKHGQGDEGKFWEITLKGRVVSTRTGKIGAGITLRERWPGDRQKALQIYDRRGRTTDRQLPTTEEAKREYDRLVAAKVKDGFKLVEDVAPPSDIEMPRNLDLEAAIAANVDDPDAYLVYADWLIAQGDPRGELITTQHAMRGQQNPAEFMTFKKREEALRTQHLASWLGPVAGLALHRIKIDWRTGFVHAVRIEGPSNTTEVSFAELVTEVLASPIARFVRTLTLRGAPPAVIEAVPETPPAHLAKLRLLVVARPQHAAVLGIYNDRGIEVEIQLEHDEPRYRANVE